MVGFALLVNALLWPITFIIALALAVTDAK